MMSDLSEMQINPVSTFSDMKNTLRLDYKEAISHAFVGSASKLPQSPDQVGVFLLMKVKFIFPSSILLVP
jgi:hypothetical protein